MKTLKDFETRDEYCEGCACEYGGITDYSDQRQCIAKDDLRAEAIKWVKELEKHEEMYAELELPNGSILLYDIQSRNDITGALTVMKAFFDLTKKDLLCKYCVQFEDTDDTVCPLYDCVRGLANMPMTSTKIVDMVPRLKGDLK